MAVVINEFLAWNTNGIIDQDGDRSDWIELRNTDVMPIDVAGWHLTDEVDLPGKWTLPSTTIAAGGYLRIFASGKDRAVSGQELHTNFSLEPGRRVPGAGDARPDKDGYLRSISGAAGECVVRIGRLGIDERVACGRGCGAEVPHPQRRGVRDRMVQQNLQRCFLDARHDGDRLRQQRHGRKFQ